MSYAEAREKRERLERKLARAKAAERDARVAEREAAKPVEPSASSDVVVVTFTKTYGGRRKYSYAAIRPGKAARWFLTGRIHDQAQSGKTWDQLMDFAATKEGEVYRWNDVRLWTPLDEQLPTREEVMMGIKQPTAPHNPALPLSIPASEYGGYP